MNDGVTLEELEKKRYLAACDHTNYTENNYYVNYLADQMAINFSEPNFYDCVYNCYNLYPEAMKIFGYKFDFSQNKINTKFLEFVS